MEGYDACSKAGMGVGPTHGFCEVKWLIHDLSTCLSNEDEDDVFILHRYGTANSFYFLN